jgi:pantetheine-phosphate adenylyltransferase
MFPLEKRRQWLEACFGGEPRIRVMHYDGLTVDFCRTAGAGFIVRGLRNASDFQFEQGIAQMNRAMAEDIETVFLPSRPELVAVNSTVVRDIIRHGGDISRFVPEEVKV